MAQLMGKVALVTGGASGIGQAICELLALEGASVVVADMNSGRGEEVVARIGERGGQAFYAPLDVTNEAQWGDTIARVEDVFRRLDVLVASAGIAMVIPSIVDMSLADWRYQNAVNLDGVFLSVKHGLPLMRRGGGGSIVLISSISGLYGTDGMAGYSASKGGVRLFAKAVALECAHAQDGVRVNSVYPGNVATPMMEKAAKDFSGADTTEVMAQLEARVRRTVPLGRIAQPLDIARGVLFLASDASSYMTGAELVLDGGRTAGPFLRA